jgi:hypothetical protein
MIKIAKTVCVSLLILDYPVQSLHRSIRQSGQIFIAFTESLDHYEGTDDRFKVLFQRRSNGLKFLETTFPVKGDQLFESRASPFLIVAVTSVEINIFLFEFPHLPEFRSDAENRFFKVVYVGPLIQTIVPKGFL